MSDTCEIIAEVVVTSAQGLPPGGATMMLGRANTTMCFYAPQTCGALPATLAAGGAIDAWAQFVQHSDAFADLNKMAFDKGCRFVISPIDETKNTWRFLVVKVDETSKTAREVADEAKNAMSKVHYDSQRTLKTLNTPSGISWLMRRLAGG